MQMQVSLASTSRFTLSIARTQTPRQPLCTSTRHIQQCSGLLHTQARSDSALIASPRPAASLPLSRFSPHSNPRYFSSTTMSSSPRTPSFDLNPSTIPELTPFIQPSSTASLSQLLKDNHESHHCFFNTRGMHNHSIHQLIADLTLSASPSQLKGHYEYQKRHYLGESSYNDRKKYDPYYSADEGKKGIEKISDNNWGNHLGNARYYWSYLHFFDGQLEQRGMEEVLQEYVFSKEANEGGRNMVVRYYGGVLHALIHVGYGLELGLSAVAAEGLAMATSTADSHAWLFPYEWLVSPPAEGEKVGLLELVKLVQEDPRLSKESLKLGEQESSLPDAPFEDGDAKGLIHEYVDRWAATQSPESVDGKGAMEELALFSALLLGAVPKTKEGYYRHEFFLMHLNNSHLFTSLYLNLFSSSPQLRYCFLRALLSQFLYYYVARGRPPFTSSHFSLETSHQDLTWEEMFKVARENVDEHLPKAVRALYVYDQRHKGAQEKLRDSGLLEGKGGEWEEEGIFELTARQLTRMHLGEVQPSQYADKEARKEGESVGAHQEFWSFDRF